MKLYITILVAVLFVSCFGLSCFAACPSMDATGDCFVDFEDFAVLASQWLTGNHIIPPSDVNMVFIPSGEFLMGDHSGYGQSDERPVHAVYVDSFYMSRYETTNQQYCDYLNAVLLQGLIEVRGGIVYTAGGGTDPYCMMYSLHSCSHINYAGGVFSVMANYEGRDMSNDPVVMVSWYGAVAYCNWRSQQEGYEDCYYLPLWAYDFTRNGYRLPTEAEWEYAARGGEYSPYYLYPWYPWGDIIDGSMANYGDSGDPYENSILPETTPVGYYNGNQTPSGMDRANGYGLYDMAGNVYELCNDWYDSDYYSSSPYNNPQCFDSGSGGRVIRGGGWDHGNDNCRVSNRSYTGSFSLTFDGGFRVCLSGSDLD